jgi:Rha family phage regulatory protein
MSQIYPDFAYNNPIQRGEIFLSTYIGEGYLEKLRPVVVIQNNLGNKHSRSIIVAAITSKPKKELPVNVVIDPTKYSLEVDNCTIMANQIFTIDKDYLRFKKGCLDAEDLGRLDEALKASFDLKSQEGKEMNELTVVNRNGRFVVDSREVAEMTEVRHSDLLEKINGYVQTLNSSENGKFRSLDFFIPHTYTVEGNTKTYPCYLLTRKGCDMIANKMTGEKGVLFTAAYVTKFEEMEKMLQPQLPQTPIEALLLAVQNMAAQEKRINQLEDTQKTIKETIVYRPDNWRNEINKMFDRVARANENRFRDMRAESYRILEERAKCDLEKRLDNLKDRKREAGATATEVNRTNKIEVIEADQRLREIYTGIIKELVIKYVA